MHPPEADDPADRSDGAQYQRHCFEFCMKNCIMLVAPALCATAFTSWRFPDQPNQPDNDHDYCDDPQNVQSERSNGECQKHRLRLSLDTFARVTSRTRCRRFPAKGK